MLQQKNMACEDLNGFTSQRHISCVRDRSWCITMLDDILVKSYWTSLVSLYRSFNTRSIPLLCLLDLGTSAKVVLV